MTDEADHLRKLNRLNLGTHRCGTGGQATFLKRRCQPSDGVCRGCHERHDAASKLSAVEVRGNNEEKLTCASGRLSERNFHFRNWLLAQLPNEAMPHLSGLPLSAEVADSSVFLAHGTPQDADQELLWAWSPSGWFMRSPDALREHLAGIKADVVVVGHSHREGITALDDWLLVNAGSAGWQVDGDPRARWTLLERRLGRWQVTFRRVVYDTGAAARWVLAQNPDALVEAEVYRTGDETGAP